MNITITGNLGSGKSAVCNILKEKGYEVISGGTIFRELAAKKNMSVIELNEYAKTDKSIDDQIDNRTAELSKIKEDVIFDCRLGWHFAKESFKVFVFADGNEAAKRVFNDNKRNAEKYTSIEQTKEALIERSYLEQERFKELYGINYYDKNNYNLLIESTFATPEQIASEIERNYILFKENPFDLKIEINIQGLLPTQAFRDFNNSTFMKYREKELNADNLCACDLNSDLPEIVQKEGLNYIVDGHHRIFAAASIGKVFCLIEGFKNSKYAHKDIGVPKREALYYYEEVGKVSYDWFDYESRKMDYLINLTDNNDDIISYKYNLIKQK